MKTSMPTMKINYEINLEVWESTLGSPAIKILLTRVVDELTFIVTDLLIIHYEY